MGASDVTIEIEVLRYCPETDKEPYFQAFKVPYTEDASVLEALLHIKDFVDGSLTFRWSCRMAICGSCGMMIDWVPKLACRTLLREYYPNKVRVEPMAHFPIEHDLVVTADDYFRKLEGIKPYIIPKEPRSIEEGEYLQTPAQREQYAQFSACINCMLCYAACPQYGLNPGFIGSGNMSILHRYNADSRDAGRDQRMDPVITEDGVWTCTAIGYCSEVCPKRVDPANAINMYKMNGAADYFRRFVKPWGTGK